MNDEITIAKTHDLADGQMKEVEIDGRSILLVRVDGQFKAYLPKCPHRGAPLAEGLLHEGRVRCPWHQAVFDALSGDLLEPPSLDRLRHYDVRVEGENVIATIPEDVEAQPRPPAMGSLDRNRDGRTFVILGAGAAGLAAAETLRQEGYHGRVVVLTREQDVSYDRTDLSKRYLADPDAAWPSLRPKEFYADNDIELLGAHEVTEVDVKAKTLATDAGTSMSYDKLLIASGSTPRRLGAEGEYLDNVFTLRSLADCERIRAAAASASKAVVVGASFIGMEVAASLAQRDVAVTVVAPTSIPFERVFGERIGRMYQRVHEDKGAEFRFGETIQRFEGADGTVRSAVLAGGERLEADLVVIGIGVQPVTGFLKGVKPNTDGSLSVDMNLRVCEDTFAAGDVARFPDWRTGEPVRIEHWRLAQQHGRHAAKSMLGIDAPYRGVPFFWTNQHKVITQYVGHVRDWDDIAFDGDVAAGEFLAFYIRGGQVHAVAGCGKSKEMAMAAEMLQAPEYPTVEDLRRQLEKMRRFQTA